MKNNSIKNNAQHDSRVNATFGTRARRLATAAVSAAMAAALTIGTVGCAAAKSVRATGGGWETATSVSARTAQVQAAQTPQANQAAALKTTDQKAAESATVLVYLNGSDLESLAGEATTDIAEMIESGIGTKANVVIETLGTKEWQDYGIASDHTQRYLVKDGKLELVDDSLGQLDTTSPDTLSDFIRWGVDNYPADRYMLLLWDHGAGPVYGFGVDEFQAEGSALTLDEIQQALAANSDVHFDLIGMDCCIMSSLETCLALQPYCDYTVLSEDFEPGVGWSYTHWMGMLEENPGVSTEELGQAIVDDMIGAVDVDQDGEATLALIDESKVDELMDAWVRFAYANEDQLLSTNYSQETEWRERPESGQPEGGQPEGEQPEGERPESARPSMMQMGQGFAEDSFGAWDEWSEYGDEGSWDDGYWDEEGDWDEWGDFEDWENLFDYWDYDGSYVTMTDYYVTDILETASTIDSDESAALKAAVEDAIVHFNSTSGEEGMTGIGVTLPYGDAEFYDQLVDVFKAVGIDGSYVDWLEAFVSAEGADNYYDFGQAFDEAYGYGDEYGYGYGDEYGYGYGDEYGYDEGYGYEFGDGYGDVLDQLFGEEYGYDYEGYVDASGYGYGFEDLYVA